MDSAIRSIEWKDEWNKLFELAKFKKYGITIEEFANLFLYPPDRIKLGIREGSVEPPISLLRKFVVLFGLLPCRSGDPEAIAGNYSSAECMKLIDGALYENRVINKQLEEQNHLLIGAPMNLNIQGKVGGKHPLDFNQANINVGEKAKVLVEVLIRKRGHDRPPFLPNEFASLLGITNIEKADLGNTCALLLKYRDGYIIKVNKNHNLSRQNFSCMHEMGHILLGNLIYAPTEIAFRNYNPNKYRQSWARDRERLCDIVATELLLPESVFLSYLSKSELSINSLEILADAFEASIQAVALRIAELSSEPCIALLWKKSKRNPSKIQIKWSTGLGKYSTIRGSFTVKQKSISYPSSLHDTYNGNSIVKSVRKFELNKQDVNWPLESKGFGLGENRYIISLVYPNRIDQSALGSYYASQS